MHTLPYVSPEPPRGIGKLILRLLSTRLNCALERSLPFRLIVWRLMPRIMRAFGKRLPPVLPFAAGLLETRDARNGRPHRRAVVYFNDVRTSCWSRRRAGCRPIRTGWRTRSLIPT